MIVRSVYDKINQYTTIRLGETKLGQVLPALKLDIHYLEDVEVALRQSNARYVLLGIPEDIGVRANYGKKGTRKAFDSFLQYFVNSQKNEFIDEAQLFVLGEVDVEDVLQLADATDDIAKLRQYCEEVDIRVFPIIQKIVEVGKIPIVIGGGHNNSYGNIKGTAKALTQAIDILNIDPHADFRIEEGRHSGNGFRYAFNQNYLSRYAVWGLHEAYNNASILNSLSNKEKFTYTTFEDIAYRQKADLNKILNFLSDKIGVELDLDSIKNMPSSAITSVGFTEEYILQILAQIKSSKSILYYHFCEGSPDENQPYKVGKFLSYLVRSIL